MTAHIPSRWQFVAALLTAGALTSAAPAQTPEAPAPPKNKGVPQTTPAPLPPLAPPLRLFTEPLLLEEEQSLEHGDRPHPVPPESTLPPRVIRSCGTPDCSMPPKTMALRCLLLTLDPLSVFIPVDSGETPEAIGMPREVERLTVMPIEAEVLDVMPAEESEYQLLGPWTDEAKVFHWPYWPRVEMTVAVDVRPAAAPAKPLVERNLHALLLKCQRELSRGHYAAAEDLAQQALTRDREQVMADPLVREGLLQRVKAIAVLPLGTVDPCAAKGEGRGAAPAGELKAIATEQRMAEVLFWEYQRAFQEGRYNEAAGLALGRFYDHYRNHRYEEARVDALQALAAAPGDATALAALQQACSALARQPRPADDPTQCPYPASTGQPVLRPIDPALPGTLQKLLIDRNGPAGGAEEAEPKEGGKPVPRR